MYKEEISLSRHMIESELFPQYRQYAETWQGKTNSIIHSNFALVFLGDFHNHIEMHTHKVPTALTTFNNIHWWQTMGDLATQWK